MRYERISIDPHTCSGKPCIRGTRIMVTNILGLIAGGYTQEQILQTYPELAREDIAAALEYASQVVEEHLTQDETKRAELHHDLDDLTGSWSADVAAAFDEALARQRTIGSSG